MPGFNINGQDSGPSNTVEYSRRNRYLFQAISPLTSSILVHAFKATRPTPIIDPIVMHHGQDEIKWPGKIRWEPLEITFYQAHDSGSDKVAEELFNWWANQVIDIKRSRINTQFKGNAVLLLLNGNGSPVWQYDIYGIWPKRTAPDSLDWGESGFSTTTVTLEFDKAIETRRIGAQTKITDSCAPAPPPLPPILTGLPQPAPTKEVNSSGVSMAETLGLGPGGR